MENGMLIRTTYNGKDYLVIRKFLIHQKINRKSIRINIPLPVVLQVIDEYNKTHGVLTEPSLQEREQGIGKRNDGTGKPSVLRMKKEQILQILTFEPPLVTLADAGKYLAKLVTEVYIVSGVHRTLTKEAFAEEITFATDYLLNAIRSEPRYRQLRSSELRLCISEGLKGRLCDDLGYPTTKTILRWIEAYSVHETRIHALNEFWRIEKRR